MHNRTERETRSSSRPVRSDPYHLPAQSVPHNNLPPRSEFIGRETEKRILLEAIASRSPLISIEGIGGIGKTALALEVAHELAEVTRQGLTDLEMARDVKLPIFEAFVWVTAKDRELIWTKFWM